MQASSKTHLSKETGMSLKSTADAPVSMFLHPVSQHADIARPRPMCLPCVQAPPQLSARHTATLGWPRAWKSKSCSVCVCMINSSPVQCYATAAVWPKPMGFWTAPRASGAEAQHSVFFHVEISHPEALECILPTETNNFSLYTTVPPVYSVICTFPIVPELSQIQTCNSRHRAWSHHWLSPSN